MMRSRTTHRPSDSIPNTAKHIRAAEISREPKPIWTAIADYGHAIELDPKDALAYRSRALAEDAKGDLDGAIFDYTQVIQLNPKYADAYNSRGYDRQQKGDLDGAIADYDQGIQLDPGIAFAYYDRGIAEDAKATTTRPSLITTRLSNLIPNFPAPTIAWGTPNTIKGIMTEQLLTSTRPCDSSRNTSITITPAEMPRSARATTTEPLQTILRRSNWTRIMPSPM